MDINIQYSENGGIEASQSFVARKSDFTLGNLNLTNFRRGVTWETVFPECPSVYKRLTMKKYDPDQSQPGLLVIKCTFTGFQNAGSTSSTTGEEETIPTSTLRGNLEQLPLNQSKAWEDLPDASKTRLGYFLTTGQVVFDLVSGKYGKLDQYDGRFVAFENDPWNDTAATGDELIFAKMIASGRTSYDAPSWTYHYRTEGSTGFTGAQLASLGKIIATPQGSPADPGAGWTWQLVGPEQDQSGPDRFIKELNYKLIRDNAENQLLYAP